MAAAGAAVDAIRLVTVASADDIALELAFIGELFMEPERAALVLVALAGFARNVVTQVAERRGEPRDEVLARMMDSAARWPS